MSPHLKMLVKPIALTVIAGLLSACGGEEVDIRQLHATQGLYYKVNGQEPFTGTATNVPLYNSPVDFGSCRTEIKSGLKDGLETCQYRDGKKYTETHYVNGSKHGDEKRWLDDGFQYADLHWANGKPNGLNKMWNAQKQPVSEIEIIDGQKAGVEKLWRDGVLEYDTVWKDGIRTGKYFFNGYYSNITKEGTSPLRKVGTDEPYVSDEEKNLDDKNASSSTPEDCVTGMIKAVHDEAEASGEEMGISQDMLDEFKSECGA